MNKKVLVLGGTGAMGVYLVPELLKRGYYVDVVSLDKIESDNERLRYFVGNGEDKEYIASVLKNGYDGIVDFMIYKLPRFKEWYDMLLGATEHYIYLSSYRVYANEEHPIKETSPRLLDVSDDKSLIESDDYGIYKAQGEDVLRNSAYKNWTTIRPAITYSKRRFQLVTLEMNDNVGRALLGKKVLLPKGARNIEGTMTWAGDVAKMIAAILFNEKALCEVYTVSTAEHHTWGEIAEYYKDLCGMETVFIDDEDYIELVGGRIENRRQLIYDREFDRVIDNSKILELSGLKQEDLMPLYEGLKLEIAGLRPEMFEKTSGAWGAMDEYIEKNKI